METRMDNDDIRLDRDELARINRLARQLYEANTHIFEDERDALAALGVCTPGEHFELQLATAS